MAKGQPVLFLESILLKAGYRAGVYSSPHLLKFNERIRINGENIQDSNLIAAFEAIEANREDISLTFFEYATLAGLYLFKLQRVDVALLEVGLGGRLDATNMVDADISVLTSIGLDHQNYLGDTRELVGLEKVEISRVNKPAIIGEPDVPAKVKLRLKEIGANASFVGEHFTANQQQHTWTFNGVRQIEDLTYPQLPLQNAITAIQTTLLFDDSISDEVIKQGIKSANVPGRMELISDNPVVILDVAHNPQAARYLKAQLAKYQEKNIYALCGMLKDKDISKVIQEITEVITHWNLVTLDVERGATAFEMKAFFDDHKQINCFTSIKAGWDDLKTKITADDVVIVFGSFYTVAGFKMLKQG